MALSSGLRAASRAGLLALIASPALAGGAFTFSLPDPAASGFRWVLNPRASAGLGWVRVVPLPPVRPGAPPNRFAVTCAGPGAVRLVFDGIAPDSRLVAERRRFEMQCF